MTSEPVYGASFRSASVAAYQQAAIGEPGARRRDVLSSASDRKAIKRMMLLEQYIAGWRAHDAVAILATLAPDCVVIESFGPIYRGHDLVARWVAKWLAEEGRVIDWSTHGLHSLDDAEVADWTFHYTWRGEEKSFDGATIARSHGGRISYLREYATTAALYDWRGEWPAV